MGAPTPGTRAPEGPLLEVVLLLMGLESCQGVWTQSRARVVWVPSQLWWCLAALSCAPFSRCPPGEGQCLQSWLAPLAAPPPSFLPMLRTAMHVPNMPGVYEELGLVSTYSVPRTEAGHVSALTLIVLFLANLVLLILRNLPLQRMGG